MATPRKGLPEVWPSGLAKWLSGESSCGFQYWFKAHHTKYEKAPSDFDFAAWRIEHTALVKVRMQELEADHWNVSVESANYFRIKGSTAILCGKPDIVARRNGVTKVVDCKGGVPKDEHLIQVVIYMIALPMSWSAPGLYVEGEVYYRTHAVPVGPERALEIKPRVFAALRELGAEQPLEARPSERECKWCDLTAADCPVKVGGEPVAVSTELF